MEPFSILTHVNDFINQLFPNLPNNFKLIVFVPLLTVLFWISVSALPHTSRKNLVSIALKNKWFYICLFISFIIPIFFTILNRPVQFFVFVDDSFKLPEHSLPFLQRWDETECNVKNTKIIKGKTDNIISLYYNSNKYGFGFQYPMLKKIDLSKYHNGELCFSLRVTFNNLQRIRIGVRSSEQENAWVEIEPPDNEKKWHDYAIPISQFESYNPKLKLSEIDLFFMLELIASHYGRLDLNNIYWKSN